MAQEMHKHTGYMEIRKTLIHWEAEIVPDMVQGPNLTMVCM